MNRLIELTLARRGLDSASIAESEKPTDMQIGNIEELADALHSIFKEKRKLIILSDYDMDGITSGVIAYAGLSELGFNVELFRSDPKEGYGFNDKVIDRLLAENPNADAVITCDCGITCHAGIAYAKKKGLEMLVTDHHMEDEANPMDIADVVVDPCRISDSFEHPHICGAHVIWRCLMFYAKKYRVEFQQDQIERLKVFAGIGTVSDMMPLMYENRQLVRDSIATCRALYDNGNRWYVDAIIGCENYRKAFKGLAIIFDAFAEAGKIKDKNDIDEMFFGFYLAPAFNSAKRMDGNMGRVFGVFFGQNPEYNIRYLLSLNEKRKKLVSESYAAMMETPQPHAPYVYISDAASGVLGLLAMKRTQETGYPACVVHPNENGSYSGSGRSPEWYLFHTRCSDTFHVAGHEGAFGISFEDETKISDIVAFLEKDVPDVEKSVPKKTLYETVDFTISTQGKGDTGIDIPLFIEYLEHINDYAPFGVGWERPRILFEFKKVDGKWNTLGADGTHLKIIFDEGMEFIAWGEADRINSMQRSFQAIGQLGVNEFNGHKTMQFIGEFV